MFYFFSKTLYYFVTPMGWVVLTLLLALALRRYRRRLTGLALLLLWLCGNPFLTNELLIKWAYPPAQLPRPDSSRQVAVMLTGGSTNNYIAYPDGHPSLGAESDRLGQVLYLYKRGIVSRILISGGNGILPLGTQPITDEGRQTGRFLVMAGIPPEAIWLDGRPVNTRENALCTKTVLQKQFRTERCILVTSASHMRRSVACFRRVGLDVLPYAGSFRQSPRSYAVAEWLMPNEAALLNTYSLIRELIGYGTYRVLGYV